MAGQSNRSTVGRLRSVLSKNEKPIPVQPTPAGWFLGPNAENEQDLTDFTRIVVQEQSRFRRDYAKGDPPFYPDPKGDPKAKAALKATRDHIEVELRRVLSDLRSSIPLASYRNQSHMYWDITMPAAAGYFAGMLYNQNNVAAEASPVTTAMEIEVAEQLCTMLGYDISATPAPWGHITCDGSVANYESMWAARNLKFHAVETAVAIAEGAVLKDARDVTVRTGEGLRKRLLDLTRWQQLNLPVDEVLGLNAQISKVTGLEEDVIHAAIETVSVQQVGLLEFYRRYLNQTAPNDAVVLVPATAHYSWVKGAALLGLGMGSVHAIPVDLDGRMDTVILRRVLEDCLATHRPVAQVVAVMGTTEEGAVDPLADILDIRDEYAERGLSFAVHGDAAWGGYFASLLRSPAKRPAADTLKHPLHATGFDESPHMSMSPYALAQFEALGGADTITIDPHKAGFMPYPAGAICYRNGALPKLIAIKAPVVYHGGSAPTVGVFGIEGSKPGAAAVGTLLSHRVIGTDSAGYGMLLGRCIFNSKRFYAAVTALPDDTTPYTVTPFQRLPIETEGGTEVEIREQLALIRREFLKPTNDDLVQTLYQNADLMTLFRSLGPDLTVFAYSFNFRTAQGVNRDAALMNEMNERMFNAMSLQIDEKGQIPLPEMFVTESRFNEGAYGAKFMQSYARRAGLHNAQGHDLRFLISTMQNPWVTNTAKGNFIPELTRILDKVAREATDIIVKRHGLTPFNPKKGG